VDDKIFEVERVIEEIGAEEVPCVRIMNKIDRLEERLPHLVRDEAGKITEAWVAARTGEGLALIDQVLRERLNLETVVRQLALAPSEGGVRARLYEIATILEDEALETGGWRMRVEAAPERLRFLEGRGGSA
jgi:GTP-binding protein HflX